MNIDIQKLCPGCMKEVANKNEIHNCPNCGYDFSNQQNQLHQLKPYTILNGKYIVGRVIGEGGFGITYLGFDLNLEIAVAIKEFYPNGFVTREANRTAAVTAYVGNHQSEYQKWRENFLREARSLAKFSSLPGIVEVRDFFQENNTVYIVMEYVEGITLKEYLKKQGGKIPTDTVLKLMEPIITSLGKVHETGIIHRDISPDNIMLQKDGGMKLLDFGAARDISAEAEKSLSVMLKPGYAPEEQYRTKGNQGPWSDVYALCATIYKCITGITPIESMERMREDTLTFPSKMGISITAAQEAALSKGMEVYAEKRYRSLEELHAALYNNANPKSISKAVTVSMPNIEQAAAKVKTELKIPNPAFIAGGAVIAVLIIAAVISISSKETKETGGISEAAKTEETVLQEQPVNEADADALLQAAQGAYAEGKDMSESGSDNFGALESLTAAINGYKQAGEYDGYYEEAHQGIEKVFECYTDTVINQGDIYWKQGTHKELYEQIINELDAAIAYGETLTGEGYSVSLDALYAEKENVYDGYRRRYIEEFNDFMKQYQWGPSENFAFIEEAYELFPTEDSNDPVRLRYAYAYAWKVHNENEKGFRDGQINTRTAVEKIISELEAVDYNEFLIQDAESYIWNEQASWMNPYYFTSYNGETVLPDSSNYVYSKEDLRSLDLSAVELRYARYEIYGRHGMKTWDDTANWWLGVVGEGISREKFMSYNDFGEFSQDSMNGLNQTERQNIRNIVQVAVEDGKFVW